MSSIGTFYKICYDREIGKGLSGSVYVATKKFDETESAVKIIKRASLSNDSIQSIANEIGALKILNHPNIVKLYDVFEDRRCFYIVMELIRGGELFDRITRKIYYLEKDARELCKIILSAIKHCHDNDIVHRDLKPENLMMASETNDTDVRIVDFGFAVRDNGSNLNGVMGSPLYMAPEIWRGETYGKGVDMWAFGVIAYILLCGYAPFNHENQDKLARLIKSGKYEFHSDHWKNVSEEAKEFVSHILQVDVSTRLTVDQALHHKWITTKSDLEYDISPSLTQLKDFNAKRKLKKAVLTVMAVGRMKHLFGAHKMQTLDNKEPSESSSSSPRSPDIQTIGISSNLGPRHSADDLKEISDKKLESQASLCSLMELIQSFSHHPSVNSGQIFSQFILEPNQRNGNNVALRKSDSSYSGMLISICSEGSSLEVSESISGLPYHIAGDKDLSQDEMEVSDSQNVSSSADVTKETSKKSSFDNNKKRHMASSGNQASSWYDNTLQTDGTSSETSKRSKIE